MNQNDKLSMLYNFWTNNCLDKQIDKYFWISTTFFSLSLVVVSPLLDLLRCLAKDAGAAAEWGHTIIHVASLQQRDKISFIRLTVSFTLMSSPLCCISSWHLSWATWWRQRGAHRSEEHTECLKVTSNCDRIVFVKKVRTTNNYTASDVFLPGWPRSSAFW